MAVIMYRLKKNGRAAVILPDGFLFGTDTAMALLDWEPRCAPVSELKGNIIISAARAAGMKQG